MHTGSQAIQGAIVPTLRYRDLAAAIEWLCRAFGFEKHVVVNGADGSARYAELTFGDGMIMLGPVEDSAIGGLMTQPDLTGGSETQICYLFVDDVAAHWAKAMAAGAEIVLDIEDERCSRGYSCRDPEGHIWNFGTYNPWRHQPDRPGPFLGLSLIVDGALRRLALGIGFLTITFAAAVAVAWALADPHAVAASGQPFNGKQRFEPQAEVGAGEAAERELKDIRQQLTQERLARQGAERAAREAEAHLMKNERERARLDAQEQIGRERSAVDGAQQIVRETREQLALVEQSAGRTRDELDAERALRLDAERAGNAAREELAKEREAKEAAERAYKELRELIARRHRAYFRRRPAQTSPSPVWPWSN